VRLRVYVIRVQVYDGVGSSDPTARTFSQNSGPIVDFFTYFGSVLKGAESIVTMLPAESQQFCTDTWYVDWYAWKLVWVAVRTG
jgi:hypothetical protein